MFGEEGLGLENFDPSGKWRTTYRNRRPVKSDGMFPNGKTFNTPRAMKGILLSEYREPIVKNFAERLLAYAIGRKLEPHDRPTVKRISGSRTSADAGRRAASLTAYHSWGKESPQVGGG